MKQILVYLLLLPVLFSCVKDDDPFKPDEPDFDPVAAVTQLNVQYGTDRENVMDVYLPANRTTATTKVIILLHGGAWSQNDKSDQYFAPVVDSVRKRLPDWAVFNLNYRLAKLTGQNLFPSQEEDVKTAVKYIFDRRQSLGISDKWVIGGESAGGHLALLQAYKYNSPVKFKAVIDFYGPTDMTDLYRFYETIPDALDREASLLGLRTLLGGTPTGNPQMYSNSSPINFVNAQSPPTIILQGELDDVVPMRQSEALRDKLASFGVTHEYVYHERQTHGWSDPVVITKSFDAIDTFLKANVP